MATDRKFMVHGKKERRRRIRRIRIRIRIRIIIIIIRRNGAKTISLPKHCLGDLITCHVTISIK
jgi:hypothetical protein